MFFILLLLLLHRSWWRLCVVRGALFAVQALQSLFLAELVGDEALALGAELAVGVRQGPEVWDGELGGPECGLHAGQPQQLMGQLRAMGLWEQHPEGGRGRGRGSE